MNSFIVKQEIKEELIMKNILYLLVLILVFMYGYYLMCKFDQSIFSPHKISNGDRSGEKFYLLVFGKTEFTKNLIEIFQENGISYDQIENESQIDSSKEYKCLFVVKEAGLNMIRFKE